MISSIIAFIAGWKIRKPWPHGVIFLVLFTSVVVLLSLRLDKYRADALDLNNAINTEAVITVFAVTLLLHVVAYALGYAASVKFSKRRQYWNEHPKRSQDPK